MSHLTKVLLRIIMARMRKSLRPEISQLQFGFVPDKSTRNAIFTLSMLAERCIEMQKDLYLCFIDYSKAFDKVRHEKLFNILEHLDIDGKDLRVIRNLYWDQSAANSARYRCQARRSPGGGLMYPSRGRRRRQSQPFSFFLNSCAATKTGHLGQKPAEPKTRVGDARPAHLPKALEQESTQRRN